MKQQLVIKKNTAMLINIFRKRISLLFSICLLFACSFKASSQTCNPEDPTAANGTSFCAPASNCAPGTLFWSQTIDQNTGTPSTVNLYYPDVTSYLIPVGTYPAALTAGSPVVIDISDVISYDGYATRSSNIYAQDNERWRMVFKKNGITVHITPYTNDLTDNVNQAYWRGSLGTAILPAGADQVFFEHWDVANPGDGSNSVKPLSICMSIIPAPGSIAGNVFNDKDGLTDNNVNQSGGLPNTKTNVSNSLYANLLNAGGQVVASVPVAADGTYLFSYVPPATYTVQLTVNASAGTYVAPAAAPATVLPAGWVNTGEFIGGTAGNDGSVNGNSSTIVLAPAQNITQVNFGIERVPDSKNFASFIVVPVPGDEALLNTPGNAKFGPLPILTGSDPEDQPIEGVLSSKSVKITTLPAFGILKYNGIPITANQVIPNFNPALFTLFFDVVAGPFVEFKYAYVDAAGFADPTPATYRLDWSGGPVPIILSEFNAIKNNCTANLSWKTSTEVNGDRFEVEVYSNNSNAGYTTVGSVPAAGNSATPKSYQYTYQMQKGVIYYFRIKMVDIGGAYKYSEIRPLSCSNIKTGIVIAPNPVVNNFKITGMEKGKNNVSIYTGNGLLVKTQVITQTQGDVDVAHLAPGMYIVKVTDESGNTVVNKLIKY